MYRMLITWLDVHMEEFQPAPDMDGLKLLESYVKVNMPGSDLEHRVHMLLDGFGSRSKCRIRRWRVSERRLPVSTYAHQRKRQCGTHNQQAPCVT